MKHATEAFRVPKLVQIFIFMLPFLLAACGTGGSTKSSDPSSPPTKQQSYVYKTKVYGNSEKIMLRKPNGKEQVVDGTGLVSGAALSADGSQVAYLKQTWGKSHNIHIKNLRANKTQVFPVGDASRFGLAWSPDGRYFYYSAVIKNQAGKPTASRALTTYDVGSKKTVRSHLTPPPGRMSVSPNNRYVAYITRDQNQPNNADSWILRLYDQQLNKYRQMGSGSDNKGVLGRIVWSHDSSNLSIASFDLNNGKRTNVRMAKYNVAFKEIGELQLNDVIYSPQHYPHFIKVNEWLHSKPQNGRVYGLSK